MEVELEALVQITYLGAHLHPELGVEVGQRLVEQEHLRLPDDGAPHGDALALAAGKLARITVEIIGEVENASRLFHPLADGVGVDLGQLQAEGHVVEHLHVGIERVVLEHHGDVALFRRHPVHHPLADADIAGGDLLQSRHHAQQGRLAAARRTDENGEGGIGHIDRYPVQHLRCTEGLADLADLDARHQSSHDHGVLAALCHH